MCTICQRPEHPTEQHYNACTVCGKAESHVGAGHYIKNPPAESCCEVYYENPSQTRVPTDDERRFWNKTDRYPCPDHICRYHWTEVVLQGAIDELQRAKNAVSSTPSAPKYSLYKSPFEAAEPHVEGALAILCDEFAFDYGAKKVVAS